MQRELAVGNSKGQQISGSVYFLFAIQFGLIAGSQIPLLNSNSEWVSFWTEKSKVWSLLACAPYVLLTLPGIDNWWFAKFILAGGPERRHGWLTSLLRVLTWTLIQLSLVVFSHITSILTDSEGVFIGSLAICSFLLVCAITRWAIGRPHKIRFPLFLAAVFWVLAIFVPILLLTDWISNVSQYGAPILTVVISVFLLAELRLFELSDPMDSWPTDGGTEKIKKNENSRKSSDPIVVSVWINCAIWRFLLQLFVLLFSLAGALIYAVFKSINFVGRSILELAAKRVPAHWIAPPMLKRAFAVLLFGRSKRQRRPPPPSENASTRYQDVDSTTSFEK